MEKDPAHQIMLDLTQPGRLQGKDKRVLYMAVYPELKCCLEHRPTEVQVSTLTAKLLAAAAPTPCSVEYVFSDGGEGLSRWQNIPENLQLLCGHGALIDAGTAKPSFTQRRQTSLGNAQSCHRNVAEMFMQTPVIVGTGFALNDSGSHPWVPHSWVFTKDGALFETTCTVYSKYWGIKLSKKQSLSFSKLYQVEMGQSKEDLMHRIVKSGVLNCYSSRAVSVS